MVHMRMRQQDMRDLERLRGDGGQQLIDLVARIDVDRVPGSLAADNVAIFEKRPHGRTFQDHMRLTILR